MDVVALDMSYWTLLSSLVLPLLVGIVTKDVASRAIKSTALLFLSAANGVVSSAIANAGILTKETAVAAVISFVVAVGSYYGFLEPSGAAAKVADKTSGIGVG